MCLYLKLGGVWRILTNVDAAGSVTSSFPYLQKRNLFISNSRKKTWKILLVSSFPYFQKPVYKQLQKKNWKVKFHICMYQISLKDINTSNDSKVALHFGHLGSTSRLHFTVHIPRKEMEQNVDADIQFFLKKLKLSPKVFSNFLANGKWESKYGGHFSPAVYSIIHIYLQG